MFLAGNIAISGYSTEDIQNTIARMTFQNLPLKIEAIRPTENAISVHLKQKLQGKIEKAGFQEAKNSLVDAFYKEFGRDNVAYDLGYPSS